MKLKATDNQPMRYLEYKVTYKGGEIVDKQLTERGHVVIDKHTAQVQNAKSRQTKLLYELDEKKAKEEKKQEPDSKECED